MRKLIFLFRNPFVIILLQMFLFFSTSFSQTTVPDTTDISKLSLEDLMKDKSQGIPSELESNINSSIEVASLTPLASRKSPGIVTVISGEEIQRSGARDLMDILEMVPGIDFAVDVEGVVGIGIRGNWANEAKVLLLINNMRMNETVFGTLQFANRYPIDQIKKIEIIRGPGSAIYGGEAEYAVINIITKSADDIDGVQINTTYGRMEHALAENNYTIAIGKRLKDFNFTLTNFFGQSNRSDQPYTDIYGNTYDMATNSNIQPMNINLGLNYKALTIHAFYDKMSLESRDDYDVVLSHAYKEYFTTKIADAEYVLKISDKFSLTPKVSFKSTNPWETNAYSFVEGDSTETTDGTYKTVANRYRFNLTSIGNISKKINVTAGIESYYETGKKFKNDFFRNSGKQEVSYFNKAAFFQSTINNKIANLTIGARYDDNNPLGSSFAPRIGLTKRIEKFNFKILYSNAFKTPTIENVENSFMGNIKPEKTHIWEFETGFQINRNMFITLNIYDITTLNTIVYFVDTIDNVVGIPDGYLNRDKAGSQGVEVEYKFMGKWGYMNLGYSFYTTQNKTMVPEYAVPGNKSVVLAFPTNKITLNTNFNLSQSLYISPAFIYNSKNNGIVGLDDEDMYIYKEFPETFYVNIFLGHNNFLIKELSAGVGMYDLLNQKTSYIQPYNSGHAPLPGTSRELFVRLNYNFHFKKSPK